MVGQSRQLPILYNLEGDSSLLGEILGSQGGARQIRQAESHSSTDVAKLSSTDMVIFRVSNSSEFALGHFWGKQRWKKSAPSSYPASGSTRRLQRPSSASCGGPLGARNLAFSLDFLVFSSFLAVAFSSDRGAERETQQPRIKTPRKRN